MTYETIWRNKWITSGATTIDEMIGSLMRGIEELQEMKKDGIEGDFDGADSDYIYFRTDNDVLATKYGMSEMEEWDEDEDEEDEEDEDLTEENLLDESQLDAKDIGNGLIKLV